MRALLRSFILDLSRIARLLCYRWLTSGARLCRALHLLALKLLHLASCFSVAFIRFGLEHGYLSRSFLIYFGRISHLSGRLSCCGRTGRVGLLCDCCLTVVLELESRLTLLFRNSFDS